MAGGIYTDQHCFVCGSVLSDTNKDVSCPNHPQVRATRFKVKFGNVLKRFKDYREASRFLTGVRYETDRKTFKVFCN